MPSQPSDQLHEFKEQNERYSRATRWAFGESSSGLLKSISLFYSRIDCHGVVKRIAFGFGS